MIEDMVDLFVEPGKYTLPTPTYKDPKNGSFLGWKVTGKSRVYSVGESMKISSSVELIAQWSGRDGEQAALKYRVRFNANGGSGSMEAVQEVLGYYKLPGCSLFAPTGKKFAGWRIYGEPNAAYFRIDGLHLSNYGYTIWGGIIKQSILDGLNSK